MFYVRLGEHQENLQEEPLAFFIEQYKQTVQKDKLFGMFVRDKNLMGKSVEIGLRYHGPRSLILILAQTYPFYLEPIPMYFFKCVQFDSFPPNMMAHFSLLSPA